MLPVGHLETKFDQIFFSRKCIWKCHLKDIDNFSCPNVLKTRTVYRTKHHGNYRLCVVTYISAVPQKKYIKSPCFVLFLFLFLFFIIDISCVVVLQINPTHQKGGINNTKACSSSCASFISIVLIYVIVGHGWVGLGKQESRPLFITGRISVDIYTTKTALSVQWSYVRL